MISSNRSTAGSRVQSPQGAALEVRPADVLWLLRAVEAEGEPRALVAQTLVNRWTWLHDFAPGRYPHLADLVRAYAQPVNPRWFPEGDLHQAELGRLERVGAPAEELARERRRATHRRDVHAVRERFSSATQSAVQRALQGPVVLPPGSLEYGPPGAPDRFPVIVPGRPWAPGQPGSNAIYGDPQGRGMGVLYGFVRPGPVRREAAVFRQSRPHGALGGVLLLFLGGFGLVAKRLRLK